VNVPLLYRLLLAHHVLRADYTSCLMHSIMEPSHPGPPTLGINPASYTRWNLALPILYIKVYPIVKTKN
jgi:hypothetical protein